MKLKPLQTLFVGQSLVELEEVPSTNSYASELLTHTLLPDGIIILAHNQTAGKGQRGASWENEPYKNLTFSIVLYPHFLVPQNQFTLNQAIALGVHDYVKLILGKEVKVKWPNDIYYKDKKLAGILIENSIRSNQIISSIIGIGININQTTFVSNAPNPTSFTLITNKEYDLKNCFQELCCFIESRYLQLKAKKEELLKKDYLHALYRFNEFFYYYHKQEKFKAKIIDIGTEGKLILERENQQIQGFDFKEITFII